MRPRSYSGNHSQSGVLGVMAEASRDSGDRGQEGLWRPGRQRGQGIPDRDPVHKRPRVREGCGRGAVRLVLRMRGERDRRCRMLEEGEGARSCLGLHVNGNLPEGNREPLKGLNGGGGR